MAQTGQPRVDLVRALEPFHSLRFDSACNLKCFYCYEKHREPDLDRVRRDIEASLRFARRVGYRMVVFESGELLMLPFWKEAVELTRDLGFGDIILVTNLTLLDADRIRTLADSGLTAVVGTIFALDDAEALSVSGRLSVFKKQLAAIRHLARHPEIDFYAHIMLTRQMAENLWTRILKLRDLLQGRLKTIMFSAIEPVSEKVLHHRSYTSALELDWESSLDRADRQGLFATVQNIPACLLGSYAHRCFPIRKRVGRAVWGWPDEPELAYRINREESLYGRLEPAGECLGCPLLSVCQRFFEYPQKKKIKSIDDVGVVRNLFAEEKIEADPRRTAETLRRIEASRDPRCLYPGIDG
jgi:uncharacterized Fe-S cluster-containing radical SAM superfamily protein